MIRALNGLYELVQAGAIKLELYEAVQRFVHWYGPFESGARLREVEGRTLREVLEGTWAAYRVSVLGAGGEDPGPFVAPPNLDEYLDERTPTLKPRKRPSPPLHLSREPLAIPASLTIECELRPSIAAGVPGDSARPPQL
jgi:hypothetical protein